MHDFLGVGAIPFPHTARLIGDALANLEADFVDDGLGERGAPLGMLAGLVLEASKSAEHMPPRDDGPAEILGDVCPVVWPCLLCGELFVSVVHAVEVGLMEEPLHHVGVLVAVEVVPPVAVIDVQCGTRPHSH